MENLGNDFLDYLVDDYYDVDNFDEDSFFGDDETQRNSDAESLDDDFEEDFEMSKSRTDTSALEARNGKDIQGIPWERLHFTREKCRETRLKQYKNYENLSRPREDLEKECLQVEMGHAFYNFQFNTRLVKSTIVHFQILSPKHPTAVTDVATTSVFESVQLRNLLWATSKHDVYLMQNYSVLHWSSLLRRSKEVLNVAKPVVPTLKLPGLMSQPLSRVQISTMAVKENLIVAGGFQGELICKYLNHPEVAFCTKITANDNAITNAVDIYRDSTGGTRIMTANNDAKVRIYDAVTFSSLGCFPFDWSVNVSAISRFFFVTVLIIRGSILFTYTVLLQNTSVSPDGKLLAVLGDSPGCLITDANSGRAIGCLQGHLDYSFTSAWHPNGQILATGNQDTTCRLWDVRKMSESMAVLKGRMGAIRAVKFSSDGRFMAMAEPADFVHIFDTQSGYIEGQEIDMFGEIAGICFSPDAESLFVGVSDRTYGSLLEFNRRRDNRYLDSMI
ncbi:SPBC2A9.03 [Cucurbita argyrosperma subsp. argyrosperma]|nr:SPBC2A9.03 [Cucurbita argyrosperma subsp. argyrosperma]